MRKYYKVEVHPEIGVTDIPKSSKGCLGLYQKDDGYWRCIHEGTCPFDDEDGIMYCNQIFDYEEIL